jgi:hypothetical protein
MDGCFENQIWESVYKLIASFKIPCYLIIEYLCKVETRRITVFYFVFIDWIRHGITTGNVYVEKGFIYLTNSKI